MQVRGHQAALAPRAVCAGKLNQKMLLAWRPGDGTRHRGGGGDGTRHRGGGGGPGKEVGHLGRDGDPGWGWGQGGSGGGAVARPVEAAVCTWLQLRQEGAGLLGDAGWPGLCSHSLRVAQRLEGSGRRRLQAWGLR